MKAQLSSSDSHGKDDSKSIQKTSASTPNVTQSAPQVDAAAQTTLRSLPLRRVIVRNEDSTVEIVLKVRDLLRRLFPDVEAFAELSPRDIQEVAALHNEVSQILRHFESSSSSSPDEMSRSTDPFPGLEGGDDSGSQSHDPYLVFDGEVQMSVLYLARSGSQLTASTKHRTTDHEEFFELQTTTS